MAPYIVDYPGESCRKAMITESLVALIDNEETRFKYIDDQDFKTIAISYKLMD